MYSSFNISKTAKTHKHFLFYKKQASASSKSFLNFGRLVQKFI